MNHSRKTIRLYDARKKHDDNSNACPFCTDDMAARAIEQTPYSYVIPNRTKYDFWEGHTVAEHYMIIPKKHVHSLNELNAQEKLDAIELAAKYESLGFNIYARGVNSPRRSVKHQHTHLIKFASTERSRVSLFIEKPYVLLTIKK